MKRKIIAGVSLAAMLAFASVARADITIGLVAPVTGPVAAYGDQVVMEETLAQALAALFTEPIRVPERTGALPQGLTAAPEADPDGDRFGNVVEYATGTNPGTRSSVPPLRVIPPGMGGEAAFEWVEHSGRKDVQITPQISDDLAIWDDVAGDQIAGGPDDVVTMRYLARALPRRYFRLSVRLVP